MSDTKSNEEEKLQDDDNASYEKPKSNPTSEEDAPEEDDGAITVKLDEMKVNVPEPSKIVYSSPTPRCSTADDPDHDEYTQEIGTMHLQYVDVTTNADMLWAISENIMNTHEEYTRKALARHLAKRKAAEESQKKESEKKEEEEEKKKKKEKMD